MYDSTSDAGTYIEPKYPRNEESDIGVFENAFLLMSWQTESDSKYTALSFEQLLNARWLNVLHIGSEMLDNFLHDANVQ